MYSLVITVNKRSVMALCDDYTIDPDGMILKCYGSEDIGEFYIRKGEIDSWFVVNEFKNDKFKNWVDHVNKSWDSLKYLIEQQKKHRKYYDCELDAWIYSKEECYEV